MEILVWLLVVIMGLGYYLGYVYIRKFSTMLKRGRSELDEFKQKIENIRFELDNPKPKHLLGKIYKIEDCDFRVMNLYVRNKEWYAGLVNVAVAVFGYRHERVLKVKDLINPIQEVVEGKDCVDSVGLDLENYLKPYGEFYAHKKKSPAKSAAPKKPSKRVSTQKRKK